MKRKRRKTSQKVNPNRKASQNQSRKANQNQNRSQNQKANRAQEVNRKRRKPRAPKSAVKARNWVGSHESR